MYFTPDRAGSTDPRASPSLTVTLVYFTPDRAGSTDPHTSPSPSLTVTLVYFTPDRASSTDPHTSPSLTVTLVYFTPDRAGSTDPRASPSLTVTHVYFTPDRAGSTDPRASPSLIVTFDLGTVGYNDQLQLYNILNRAVNSGQIAQYSVSPSGLAFRPLRGKRYNQYSLITSIFKLCISLLIPVFTRVLFSVRGLIFLNDIGVFPKLRLSPPLSKCEQI